MATSKELLKAIEEGKEIRITFGGEPTGGLVEYSPRYKGDRKAWTYTDSTGMDIRYAAKDVAAVTPAPVVEETSAAEPTKPVVTPQMVQALTDLRTALAISGSVNQAVVRRALQTLMTAGVFAEIDAVTGCTCKGLYRYETHGIHGDFCPGDKATATVPEPVKAAQCDCSSAHLTRTGQHREGCSLFASVSVRSDCTCPGGTWDGQKHLTGCPEAPQAALLKGGSTRRVDERRAKAKAEKEKQTVRWQRAVGITPTQERTFPPETTQCDFCRGDYVPKGDGTLRKHSCWRYDHGLSTIVYGPLDRHGRAEKVAANERAATIRKSIGF